MLTDAALLAQLQSLWQAAATPIVPPPALIDRSPKPSPESTPATSVSKQGEGIYIGTSADWQEMQAEILAGILDGEPPDWIFAEDAALNDGIERTDVPRESRWWGWATFDQLPYGDGRLPELPHADGDPFENVLADEARQYLLDRHRYPSAVASAGAFTAITRDAWPCAMNGRKKCRGANTRANPCAGSTTITCDGCSRAGRN